MSPDSAMLRCLAGLLLVAMLLVGCGPEPSSRSAEAPPDTLVLRIATYNLEDVRTADVKNPDHPRLKQAAAILQRLRPDVLLINEMTYDQPGAPGYVPGDPPGRNGQRFADAFLGVSQEDGLEPLHYRAFMAPVNTGLPSGFDLDNDGRAVTEPPAPTPPSADGSVPRQTAAERAYGNDAWGFGIFPGQYGMALLVRDDLEILHDSIRTFRLLRWSEMPDAKRPIDPATGAPWYSEEEWAQLRLSSKSHWDVPVRLPNEQVVHVLASHPTPPAFDGPERRNGFRNHDEIRLWADYLDGAAYVVDDSSRAGELHAGARFVLLGDQNADPDEGNALGDPMGTFLLDHPRVNTAFVPKATRAGVAAYPDLDPDDTAAWGLRVDYVLPSAALRVLDGGVLRPVGADTTGVPISDHFPVWIDIAVP